MSNHTKNGLISGASQNIRQDLDTIESVLKSLVDSDSLSIYNALTIQKSLDAILAQVGVIELTNNNV